MLSTLLVILTLMVLYWFPVRRWFGCWGTNDEDLTRVMTGDAVIANPTHSATHALTVAARPEDIWPWLVQMGYRRGGLYSYDWLDRLFGYLDGPSANHLLPEFQQLAVGDVIPLGRGKGFPVTAVEPYRALVLSDTNSGFQWVWQFGLYQLEDGRTRLVSRGTQRFANTIGRWLFMRVMEPAAFLMTRRMLLGLKQRAEAHRTARGRDIINDPKPCRRLTRRQEETDSHRTLRRRRSEVVHSNRSARLLHYHLRSPAVMQSGSSLTSARKATRPRPLRVCRRRSQALKGRAWRAVG